MADVIVCFIMIPLVFFTAINFIFQETLAITAETYFDQINCEEPSFNQAYNSTTHPDNPCASAIDEDTPYDQQEFILWQADLNFFDGNTTNNWVASVPNGWINYTLDYVTVKIAKAGAVVNLMFLPFTVPAEIDALGFISYINIGLFVMVGIGIYIVVNPFK